MRPAAIALNYSVKDIRNHVRQIIWTDYSVGLAHARPNYWIFRCKLGYHGRIKSGISQYLCALRDSPTNGRIPCSCCCTSGGVSEWASVLIVLLSSQWTEVGLMVLRSEVTNFRLVISIKKGPASSVKSAALGSKHLHYCTVVQSFAGCLSCDYVQ